MSCPNSSVSTSWFVYIVLTDNRSLYTGITTDLERRFREHRDTANGVAGAKGAKFFRSRKPLKIVYSEACATRSEATKREAEIKALSREQKQNLLTTGFAVSKSPYTMESPANHGENHDK